MYENQTFNAILQRMMDRIPNHYDKREGSVIYNALAPAAAELAQMYIELEINHDLSYADTSTGEFLTRRAEELGVNREPATRARRKGEFYGANNTLVDVPLGSRYSIDNLNFRVVEKITTGEFVLEAEQLGTVGNQKYGNLLPIEFVPILARAVLSDILVPGEDEETDEALRQRYYEVVNEPAFGGNVADYKQKVNSIDGVGATKVYPVWQGGGTVRCVIIASDWTSPSPALVNVVQTTIDPEVNRGQGIGLAPIGHEVTINGTEDVIINMSTILTLQGVTLAQVQQPIVDAVNGYLLGLRQSWASESHITVRVALIESVILSVPGVADITGTELNGSGTNLVLESDAIPLLGTVTLHE